MNQPLQVDRCPGEAGKVPTCLDAIADWLTARTEGLEQVGMETGPLAVWLCNALSERQVPIVCIDARHANGLLKMMPVVCRNRAKSREGYTKSPPLVQSASRGTLHF